MTDFKMYPPKVQSIEEAEYRFGKIENGSWKDESKHMLNFWIPETIAKALLNSSTGRPITKIYCNVEMIPALKKAFFNVEDRGLIHELKTFDGCFCIRNVRGGNTLSAHAYGLAIDLNAAWNGLGQEPEFSPEFVACFTGAGFVWGGDFKRKDPMHFQWATW